MRQTPDAFFGLEVPRKPPVAKKCCGTCRWWYNGLCLWALSGPIAAWMDAVCGDIGPDEGTDCNVWEEAT